MKFDLLKDELSTILDNLSEQYEMMDGHKGNIPQIELDIFMRNTQKLYENTIYLNKENQKSRKTKVLTNKAEQKTEIIEKIEVTVELEKEDVVAEPIADVIETKEEVKKPEESPVSEKISEIQEQPKEEIVSEITEEEIAEAPMFVSSLGIPSKIQSSFDDILDEVTDSPDLFSDVQVSPEITDLNEKLAEARNTRSVVEKLQNQRIESLKSVIGINDKFYFINELFGGDAKKYEDIIYTLNNFKKLDEAMQYFSTLKYRFSWTEESIAFEKLSNMLERKFDLINA